MQRETEYLSNVSVLKAALSWEKGDEALDYDTAPIIALHYQVLALRKMRTGSLYWVSIMFIQAESGGGKQSTCWLTPPQRTRRLVWI